MKLHTPFEISARLMPALRIGGATVSLGQGARDGDGRTHYNCYIDLPGGEEHEVSDLRSGCQGGTVLEGFSSLLSFLSAAAESYSYAMRTPGQVGENADLFPPAVVEWAYQNSDEISSLQYDIENADSQLIED